MTWLKTRPSRLDDVRKEFNPEIASLVDGVTKLTQLPNLLRGDHHTEDESIAATKPGPHKKIREDDIAEVLRKTFLAMSDDIRVVLIKLADRLHNMRTLVLFQPKKTKNALPRNRLKSLRLLPIASGSGKSNGSWKTWPSVTWLPKEYKEIAEKLADRRADREHQVQDIVKRLQEELEAEGVEAQNFRPSEAYLFHLQQNGAQG